LLGLRLGLTSQALACAWAVCASRRVLWSLSRLPASNESLHQAFGGLSRLCAGHAHLLDGLCRTLIGLLAALVVFLDKTAVRLFDLTQQRQNWRRPQERATHRAARDRQALGAAELGVVRTLAKAAGKLTQLGEDRLNVSRAAPGTGVVRRGERRNWLSADWSAACVWLRRLPDLAAELLKRRFCLASSLCRRADLDLQPADLLGQALRLLVQLPRAAILFGGATRCFFGGSAERVARAKSA